MPMPNTIKKGNQMFTFEKNCKISIINDKKSDYLDLIITFYSKILNARREKNINKKFSIENVLSMYAFSDLSCEIFVKLKVNTNEMYKYDNNYKTSFEKYALEINTKNNKKDINIVIEAFALNGVLRGLETLSQLMNFNSYKNRFELYNLPLVIIDEPYYEFRGVMIDTSRHFISLNKIKEVIDGMMYSKLNVLHWHLTDDEFFGFGSDLLNKTSQPEFYYTKADMKDIIDYAYIRGVTVLPEIDQPSHTKSWKSINESIVLSIPEMGTLNPSLNITYDTVDKLIKEAIKLFSPQSGGSFHLGGDEVMKSLWNTSQINQFMIDNNLTNINELENYYFNRVRSTLPKDKTYYYWLDAFNYDVFNSNNTILMYWGLLKDLSKFDTNQWKIIFCPGDYLYLDCGSGGKYGDDTWCGNYKTWKRIYQTPLNKTINNLTVVGSEIVLFGELADEFSFIGKIFPRASSFAERVWSQEISDIKSVFLRLLAHNKRLIERGVDSISFTTQLCEVNPEECLGSIQLDKI